MALIKKSWIKLIKLILISKYLHMITLICFLTSIPILFIKTKLKKTPNTLTNYLSTFLNIESFNKINTIEDFQNYLQNEYFNLFDKSQSKNIFTFNGMRLVTFYYNKCDYLSTCETKECLVESYLSKLNNACITDSTNTFNNESNSIKESKYSARFSIIEVNYIGKFNSFNFYTLEKFKKITDISNDQKSLIIQETNNVNKNKLKGMFLITNHHSLYFDRLFTSIIGIEFDNESKLFTHFKTFSYVKTYHSDILVYFSYVLLVFSVIISSLMLIYEVNTLPKFNTQIFSLLEMIFCYGLIGYFLIYFSIIPQTSLEEELTETLFINNLVLEQMEMYYNIFLSLILLAYPFKFFKLLSFFNYFKTLISYTNIIFKLGPGILLSLSISLIMWICFSIIMNILYGNNVSHFSYLITSVIYLFQGTINIDEFSIEPNNYNIQQSSYLKLFNLAIFFFIWLNFIIIFSTTSFNFKYAYELEFDIEDPIMNKLDNIKDQLDELKEEKEIKRNNNIVNKKNQIIWLNLTNNIGIFQSYNIYMKGFSFIHFISAQQVISFMKYIFGISPQLQFNNLEKRFTIIIQLNSINKSVDENRLKDIENIVNWLNYIRSKINVIFVSDFPFDKFPKYCIGLSYENVNFCCFSQYENNTSMYDNQSELSKLINSIFTPNTQDESSHEQNN